jgi:hypothetical protein
MKFIVFIVLLFQTMLLQGQNSSFRGYLKYLSGFNFDQSVYPIYYTGIIHHRLETNHKIGEWASFRFDVRNRMFHGYSVDDFGFYEDFLNRDGGWQDLTAVPFANQSVIFQSMIDRLQITARNGNFEMNVGRQRLNWGKSFVWSPNDLFNNYAFLDFDYEERPGTDAVQLGYAYGFASEFQIAFRPGQNSSEHTYAALWRTNIESISYDIQLLMGSYKNQFVLGSGWSGYVKNAGFSGELSIFEPFIKPIWVSSVGVDYQFSNGFYSRLEWLYNGGYQAQTSTNLLMPPSPQNLFPSSQALYVNGSFSLTPLTQIGIGLLSSLNDQLHAVLPQINLSVTQNIDFFLIAQLFRGDLLNGTESEQNAVFARIKWSY